MGTFSFFETITFQADGAYNGVPTKFMITWFWNQQPSMRTKTKPKGALLMNQENFERERTWLTDSGSKIQFKSIFLPFSNSKLKVTFQYTILQNSQNYLDRAMELNRKVKSEKSGKSTNTHYGEGEFLEQHQEKRFVHGHGAGQNGDVKFVDDYRSVTLTAPGNKSGDFVEVHMLILYKHWHALQMKNESFGPHRSRRGKAQWRESPKTQDSSEWL